MRSSKHASLRYCSHTSEWPGHQIPFLAHVPVSPSVNPSGIHWYQFSQGHSKAGTLRKISGFGIFVVGRNISHIIIAILLSEIPFFMPKTISLVMTSRE